MKKYEWDISLYRSETAHLNILEHGVFRALIDTYYDTEQPITNNKRELMRKLSLAGDDEVYLDNVLRDFFTLENNTYVNRHIELQLKQYRFRCQKNRLNGKLGGRPLKTQVDIEDKPKKSELKPNGLIKLIPKDIQENFKEFWARYPKKVGKDKALEIWLKKQPRIDDVMYTLSWQIESPDWRKEDGKYIPMPSTYLNQGRWQDEPPVREAF